MITGVTNMGCWHYSMNMGTWQAGQPNPSRRFLGTVSNEPKFEGDSANEPKFEGAVSNEPKFGGDVTINS